MISNIIRTILLIPIFINWYYSKSISSFIWFTLFNHGLIEFFLRKRSYMWCYCLNTFHFTSQPLTHHSPIRHSISKYSLCIPRDIFISCYQSNYLFHIRHIIMVLSLWFRTASPCIPSFIFCKSWLKKNRDITILWSFNIKRSELSLITGICWSSMYI